MTDAGRSLRSLPDEALEAALRDLGGLLAFPGGAVAGAPDAAARARRRIVASSSDRRAPGWWRLGSGRRTLRRSFVLAVVALLVVAAAVTAIGWAFPGLRITFGERPPAPSPSASPTTPPPSSPVGAGLGLGTAVSLAEAERLAGFDILLPTEPAIGPPDAVYRGTGGRVALVWASGPELPATANLAVGLVLNEFRGAVTEGYYEKILAADVVLTPVTVAGGRGVWISGPPHFFMYVAPDGRDVDDSHRVVGDTLVWTAGGITYRLESGLAMDDAIGLAESLR